jgi:hypothetical protein
MSSDNPPEVPPEPSFIINNDELNDDTQTIVTDLYTAVMYLNRFSKTQMNGGYLQISYFMPSGTMRPNATYISGVNVKKYKCANLYIFKASHRITMDGSFDGELVVELIPIVNTSEKLYLCFLLKNTRYNNNERNDIDELIKNSVKPPMHYDIMNFNLQNMVEPKQKKIVYKSGIDNVIIFLSPISINEVDFSNYSTISQGLFAIYPVNKEYKMIIPSTKEGFSESFREGSTVQDVQGVVNSELNTLFEQNLVTCSPVDYNNTTDNTAVYLADTSRDKLNAQSAVGTAIIVMIVVLLISFFLSPHIFKNMLANIITDGRYLTFVSVIIVFFIFILGLSLVLSGISYDSDETLAGAFILIFLTLSVMSVSITRKLYPGTYSNVDFERFKLEEIPVFIYTFGLILHHWDTEDKRLLYLIIIFIAGFFISFVFILPIVPSVIKKEKKQKGYTNHLRELILSIGIIYGIMLSIWIIMIIKYTPITGH